MLKAAAEQFRESYPELYAKFDVSYLMHIQPILDNTLKKINLLLTSLLNPSIHYPIIF